MSTLRKQIVDALLAAINSGSSGDIPEATRLRQSQIETGEQPSISVYPGDESISPATNRPGALVKRTLAVIVECRAAGDEPDVLLDPLLSWVERKVTAASSPLWHDAPQAVLVRHEYAIGQVPHGLAQLTFSVSYQTRRDNPEAAH